MFTIAYTVIVSLLQLEYQESIKWVEVTGERVRPRKTEASRASKGITKRNASQLLDIAGETWLRFSASRSLKCDKRNIVYSEYKREITIKSSAFRNDGFDKKIQYTKFLLVKTQQIIILILIYSQIVKKKQFVLLIIFQCIYFVFNSCVIRCVY